MARTEHTHTLLRVLIALLTAGTLAGLSTVTALALSPTPADDFEDFAPSVNNTSYLGVVVEGLGMNSCSYSLSSVESATVRYINEGQGVLTEISPQSGCASLSTYENMVSSLVSYVESHSTNPGQYWGGIMLDEEDGFGFSVSSLISLNSYVNSKMDLTPGISFWYSEVFSGSGVWSQANYNAIVGNSYPAPQISTTYMVQLANGRGAAVNLVTWSTGYPYPFNTKAYSDGKITGTPYYVDFYGCNCGHIYFDNQFAPA